MNQDEPVRNGADISCPQKFSTNTAGTRWLHKNVTWDDSDDSGAVERGTTGTAPLSLAFGEEPYRADTHTDIHDVYIPLYTWI